MEHHASDISNVLIQQEVENSLLGDDQPQSEPQDEPSEYSRPGADLLAEAVNEQYADPFRNGGSATLEVDRFYDKPEKQAAQPDAAQEQLEQRETRAPEPEQDRPEQQPQSFTAEEIEQSRQQMDAVIERAGLNVGRERWAADLAMNGASSYDAALEFTPKFTHMLLATEAQREQTGGDTSKLSPLSQAEVAAHTRTLSGLLGINPQMNPIRDPQSAAELTRFAIYNFLNTADGNPGQPIEQLNDPHMCVWFFQQLEMAMSGRVSPITPEYVQSAVSTLNLFGQRILAIRQQANSFMSTQGQHRQRGPNARRQSAKQSVPWTSNLDIFGPDSVEEYRRHHGKL